MPPRVNLADSCLKDRIPPKQLRELEDHWESMVEARHNLALKESREDAENDIFLAILAMTSSQERSGQPWDNIRDVRAYVIEVARRAFWDMRRRQMKRDQKVQTRAELEHIPANEGQSQTFALERDAIDRAIQKAVKNLSPRDRDMCHIAIGHGLSQKQIAGMFDLSESRVSEIVSPVRMAVIRIFTAD